MFHDTLCSDCRCQLDTVGWGFALIWRPFVPPTPDRCFACGEPVRQHLFS